MNEIEAVKDARKKHDELRAAVVAWMNAEGAAGRFRHNSDAPMWSDYKEAADALDAARQKAGV